MVIDAKMVAALRELTGAGMMDAKRALEESSGDIEKASEILRTKGITKAAKKADRETKEGRVYAYTHSTGKLAVLVEVLCETDFVARNEGFTAFCNDIALHVAAMSPEYLSREDVPADALTKERELIEAELREQGKPSEMIEKIVGGKLEKYYSEHCLLEQPFVKDEEKTVGALLSETIAKLGENIQIRRFTRLAI